MSSHLSQIIKIIEEDVRGLCTHHLRERIAEDAAEFSELIGRLEQLTAQYGTSDGEYADTSADVVASALYLAVSVLELTGRPVLWATPVNPN